MADNMTDKHREIWEKLSKVDVSEHVEKRDGGKFSASYLSWTWAWATLMQHYPSAKFIFLRSNEMTGCELFEMPDGSAEVRCVINIEGVTRQMWLPVMDNYYDAIADPTSREVSDAKMRCLVKCLALFGLGFKLYAGEDLPSEDKKRDTRPGRKDQRNKERSNDQRSTGDTLPSPDEMVRTVREAPDFDILQADYTTFYRYARTRGNTALMDDLEDAKDIRKIELEEGNG